MLWKSGETQNPVVEVHDNSHVLHQGSYLFILQCFFTNCMKESCVNIWLKQGRLYPKVAIIIKIKTIISQTYLFQVMLPLLPSTSISRSRLKLNQHIFFYIPVLPKILEIFRQPLFKKSFFFFKKNYKNTPEAFIGSWPIKQSRESCLGPYLYPRTSARCSMIVTTFIF